MKLFYPFAVLTLFFTGFFTQLQATVHEVEVSNFSFTPNTLNDVFVGDTVRFIWVSGTHTTTSTSVPQGAAAWDEPITSNNTEYDYVVEVLGNYAFVCTPHPGSMTGTFTAQAATSLPNHFGSATELLLYPNPARNQLTLELFLQTAGTVKLELLNSLGQLQLVRNNLTYAAGRNVLNIGLSERNLTTGLYFARVTTAQGVITRKFYIQ
jgi:plastocyanin